MGGTFARFVALLLDAGEFTLIPFLLGIAVTAVAGWRLGTAYFPGSEYFFAAMGAIAGVFTGIILAGGLVGWLLGALVGYLGWSLLGIGAGNVASLPAYVGAALGGMTGLLGTVVSLANTIQALKQRRGR